MRQTASTTHFEGAWCLANTLDAMGLFLRLGFELALFAHTAGSARLSLGGTDVVVGVTAELAEPDAATPDEGRIVVSVGASAAMAEDELLDLGSSV